MVITVLRVLRQWIISPPDDDSRLHDLSKRMELAKAKARCAVSPGSIRDMAGLEASHSYSLGRNFSPAHSCMALFRPLMGDALNLERRLLAYELMIYLLAYVHCGFGAH